VPRRDQGSHHISYLGFPTEVRLTTDVPLSYLDGVPFALTEKKYLVLAWGEPVQEPLVPLCERFLVETVRYWQRWVKHSDVPPAFQSEVIRSALALKLHCYEDTGAIVAAITAEGITRKGLCARLDYFDLHGRVAFDAADRFRCIQCRMC
jgi:hypothetical protein